MTPLVVLQWIGVTVAAAVGIAVVVLVFSTVVDMLREIFGKLRR